MENKQLPHNNNDNEEKKTSLKDFIKENHLLINSLGVFIALTIFSSNIDKESLAFSLSFLFITASLTILYELYISNPKDNPSIRLLIFKASIYFGWLGVLFYWLNIYREVLASKLFFFFLLLLSWSGNKIIKKYSFYDINFWQKNKLTSSLKVITKVLMIILLILVSSLLGQITKPFFLRLLESTEVILENFI